MPSLSVNGRATISGTSSIVNTLSLSGGRYSSTFSRSDGVRKSSLESTSSRNSPSTASLASCSFGKTSKTVLTSPTILSAPSALKIRCLISKTSANSSATTGVGDCGNSKILSISLDNFAEPRSIPTLLRSLRKSYWNGSLA